DRKSTRLNSSHDQISYAVFCLKKKRDGPTAAMEVAGLLDAAMTFTDAVTASKSTSVPNAIFRIQEYALRIANSNDVLANHRSTLVFAYLTAKCGSKGKFGEGILKAMNTSIRAIDFAHLG